ncbi:HAD-IA family hydrolase [Amycolatopsis aidingensis]|uniref:HAD-IA family hydrolase n=1 Tax=Amycolatopsis aidingensis TaxID=2842453 RepID=UPI001E39AF97|nr:HAD-IA family hydrolase [Amycolatopsis aidingensis]
MDVRGIRILTFDVVGTLIDFETGILDCLRPVACGRTGAELLEAFGRAEDVQARLTPRLPFTQMLEPIYLRLATELDLPRDTGQATALRESIPRWPAFPDSAAALRTLGRRFRLVALTNTDNWALEHMARTLGEPFDDAVTAQDAGTNKPDPQVFAYCRGRQSVHGYTLPDYLHIAQSQYHDIGVATALG